MHAVFAVVYVRTFGVPGLGASGPRRSTLVRFALAVVLLGGALWALPVRRAGEEGGHHQTPPLDLFEKAGVTEFKEGQRGPAFTIAALDGSRASPEMWKDKLAILNSGRRGVDPAPTRWQASKRCGARIVRAGSS